MSKSHVFKPTLAHLISQDGQWLNGQVQPKRILSTFLGCRIQKQSPNYLYRDRKWWRCAKISPSAFFFLPFRFLFVLGYWCSSSDWLSFPLISMVERNTTQGKTAGRGNILPFTEKNPQFKVEIPPVSGFNSSSQYSFPNVSELGATAFLIQANYIFFWFVELSWFIKFLLF